MVNFVSALVGIDVVVAKFGDGTIFVGIPSTCNDTTNDNVNPINDNI